MFNYLVYLNLLLVPLIFLSPLTLSFEIPKMAAFRITTLLILLVYFWELSKSRKLRILDVFSNRTFKKLLLGFVGLLFVGVFFSIAPKLSFWGSYFRMQGALAWIHYFLFFGLLCLKFHKKEDWEKAFKVLFAGFGLVLLLGLLQKFGFDLTSFDLQERSLGRVSSTAGHPNYLASYILLIFFPLLGFKFKRKVFKWALVILTLAVLVFTGSRAGFLGLGAGLILYLSFTFKARRALAFTLLVALLVSSFALLSGRFNFAGENLRSLDTRLLVWPATLEMIGDSPVFGHGIETFPLAFAQYADPDLIDLERPDLAFDRAHNSLLDTMSDLGVAGLIFYLAVVVWLFWRPVVKNATGVMSGLAAFLVANLWGFSVTLHLATVSFLLAYLMFLFSKKTKVRTLGAFKKAGIRRVGLALVSFFVLASILLQNVFVVLADYNANEGFKALYRADVNEVVIRFDRASWLWPNQSFYNYFLAEVLLQIDELEPADEYAERGGDFVSKQDYYYFLLKGKIFNRSGELEKALTSFRKAFDLAPTYPPILLNWGITYIENGKCKLGVRKLEEYLSLIPKDWQNEGSEEYRLFYKHNPNFDQVFIYLEKCDHF